MTRSTLDADTLLIALHCDSRCGIWPLPFSLPDDEGPSAHLRTHGPGSSTGRLWTPIPRCSRIAHNAAWRRQRCAACGRFTALLRLCDIVGPGTEIVTDTTDLFLGTANHQGDALAVSFDGG